MNREFKFRVYNEINKKMDPWEEVCTLLQDDISYYKCENDDRPHIHLAEVFDSLMDEKFLHFMQYTGLKDRNGVEIYDGDIVQSKLGQIMTDVVEWDEGGCWSLKNNSARLLYTGVHDWQWEIIGNIYENPELLK